MDRQTCDTCHNEKPQRRFGRSERCSRSGPHKTTCLACESRAAELAGRQHVTVDVAGPGRPPDLIVRDARADDCQVALCPRRARKVEYVDARAAEVPAPFWRTCTAHRPRFFRGPAKKPRRSPASPLPPGVTLEPLPTLRAEDFGGWASNGAATRAG